MSKFNIPSSSDLEGIRTTIERGPLNKERTISLSVMGESAEITATSGASTLLAASSASNANRKALVVRNDGPTQVRVSNSSTNAIYTKGFPIEPGETVTFSFVDASIDLYVRSMGYASTVTIWEI